MKIFSTHFAVNFLDFMNFFFMPVLESPGLVLSSRNYLHIVVSFILIKTTTYEKASFPTFKRLCLLDKPSWTDSRECMNLADCTLYRYSKTRFWPSIGAPLSMLFVKVSIFAFFKEIYLLNKSGTTIVTIGYVRHYLIHI